MARRSRLISTVLPLVGIVALAFAGISIARHQPSRPLAEPSISPPKRPFEADGNLLIGAVGLVEAASEQIGVAAEIGGVTATVEVKPNDRVHRGDVLFTLDDRAARADLAVRIAALGASRARLNEAVLLLSDVRDQLDRGERIYRPSPGLAISEDALTRRRYAAETAQAKLASAQADVVSQEAQVHAGEVALAMLTIRSPLDATVLQTNIRPGEYAPANATAVPLVILGLLDPLHVRVDIDEVDVPLFDPKARAFGAQWAAGDKRTALQLVRVDPIIVPKTSLTGAGTERVDTRVLRVVYAFDPSSLPSAYPGAHMDVFIQTDSSESGAGELATKRPAQGSGPGDHPG